MPNKTCSLCGVEFPHPVTLDEYVARHADEGYQRYYTPELSAGRWRVESWSGSNFDLACERAEAGMLHFEQENARLHIIALRAAHQHALAHAR